MYGTRNAAANWHEEYSQQLIANGFTQGLSTPCVFRHETRNISIYVHGDDYVSTGMETDLLWLEQQLKKK